MLGLEFYHPIVHQAKDNVSGTTITATAAGAHIAFLQKKAITTSIRGSAGAAFEESVGGTLEAAS